MTSNCTHTLAVQQRMIQSELPPTVQYPQTALLEILLNHQCLFQTLGTRNWIAAKVNIVYP